MLGSSHPHNGVGGLEADDPRMWRETVFSSDYHTCFQHRQSDSAKPSTNMICLIRGTVEPNVLCVLCIVSLSLSK